MTGDEVLASLDVILKVNAPNDDEIALLNPGTTLISFIWPAQKPAADRKSLAARNINVMAMDSVPRISRAQSLDALSSMANIAGYRAIVEAARMNLVESYYRADYQAAGKVAARQGDGHWRRGSRSGGDWRRRPPRALLSAPFDYPSGSEGAGAESGRRVPRAGL